MSVAVSDRSSVFDDGFWESLPPEIRITKGEDEFFARIERVRMGNSDRPQSDLHAASLVLTGLKQEYAAVGRDVDYRFLEARLDEVEDEFVSRTRNQPGEERDAR